MERQYLIDSNAVIDFLAAKLPPTGLSFMNKVVNDIPKVSVITKIEVLSYNVNDMVNKILSDFIGISVLLDLTEDVVAKTIELRKAYKIKTPDAIVAATALSFDLTLLTRNVNDFKNISALKVINPWEIK